MNLYGQYTIAPREHTVSQPELAAQRYVKLGVKKAFAYVVMGLVVSGILLGIHLCLDAGVTEDRYEGIVDWIATLVWGAAGVIGVFIFPYMLWCAIRCLLTACRRPDQSKPERVVKAFLNSTQSSLNIRAYNLLTDQARHIGKVYLTSQREALAKQMPDVQFTNFESFDAFWIRMDSLSWHYKSGSIERVGLGDDNAVLLRVPTQSEDPKDDNRKIRFQVEFLAVRRGACWYLANGFVWPS